MAYYSKLSPSDAGSIGSQPNFGEEVGIGNGKVAVGAPLADEGSTLNRGAVYVYDLDGSNEVKITPSAYPNVAIQFGQNVSIGSNKILVGSGADACFLYDLDGSNEVLIDPGYSNGNFGFDKQGIAIYGDKFYISDSNLASNTRLQVGAVYIYRLSDQALLKVVRPSDANDPNSETTGFGYSIDVKDNVLVVGCPTSGEDGSTGKVFVYDLDGNNERIIEASDGVTGDYLGWKVGIDSGRIIASARLWHPSRDGQTSGRGGAYSWNYDGSDERFFRQGVTYGSETLGDAFSEDSLVAGGGRVYIGARYFENGGRQGSVFSYTVRGRGEYNFLSSDPNASAGDHYSYSMDFDDASGYLVVGAVFFGTPVVGAAYVYQVAAPSNKIRNLSSSSTTGTINGATFNPAGYFEFDGVNDRISVAGPIPTIGTGDFAIECWIYLPNVTPTNCWRGIVTIGNGFQTSGGITLYAPRATAPANTAVAILNAVNPTIGGTSNVNDSAWHHIVLTRVSSTLDIYVDSVSEASEPNTANITETAVTLGRDINCGTTFYQGNIGQLRIYTSKGLTAAEVLQNFNATRGKYGV
jgi:hypothetical protein